MTPETTKLFRINLLRQLKAAAPQPLPVPALLTGARLEAFKAEADDVERELEYLREMDPPFVARHAEAFSSAVKRYRILPAGREWLEMEGF